MLLLSFRKNFTHPVFFGEMPRVRIADGLEIGLGELDRRIRGKRVLLLIHGYHNSVVDTMDAYGTIEANLRDRGLVDETGRNPAAYEVVIGLLWPGSFAVFGFWLAWLRADKAGRILADLMQSWKPAFIDVETHSLGARVALVAASRPHGALVKTAQVFRNAFLTAPAVSDGCLQAVEGQGSGGSYARALDRIERIHVLYSESDSVLSCVFRLAMWRRALGSRGPSGTIAANVFSRECTTAAARHGSYKSSWMVYAYWNEQLMTRSVADTGENIPRDGGYS